jgi:multidrug efflux pump subunit AcrA (membrane-fusion protein)
MCGVILFAGLVIMKRLAALREPPKQAEVPEARLRVEVLRALPESVPVLITGYGEARSRDVVGITPEVAGMVVEIHPRLEAGEVIPEGDLLFRIDPRDYQAAMNQASANVSQMRDTIVRLKKQYEVDRSRLDTIRSSRDLAQREFNRVRQLFEQEEVGTQSGVEKAEMGFNQAQDAYDLLAQAVELYPVRIRETEAGLAAAEAALELSKTRFGRTEVRAPFQARIREARVELGQYVMPGAPVMTLANDALLEIPVPLDSRDVRDWLGFAENSGADGKAWFAVPEPVRCRIFWTEAPGEHYWEGALRRVQQFDRFARTVTVAIEVCGSEIMSTNNRLPLVDGMFCRVDIPGKMMQQVFRLPRWAVTFEEKVFVAKDKRLEYRDVTVVRTQGEETFVSEGLQPGELVVVTRLVNPLPGSLLDYDEVLTASAEAEPAL